jgi:hypothetical protein
LSTLKQGGDLVEAIKVIAILLFLDLRRSGW